jgi:hypothetical protein
MNRTELVDLKFFYNFYSLHFSVGHVSMIASLSKKWSKVEGFDGNKEYKMIIKINNNTKPR